MAAIRTIGLMLALGGALCSAGCIAEPLTTSAAEDEPAAMTEEGERDRAAELGRELEPGSCDAWKFAYCDAIAECDAFSSREACELDLGWLSCAADAPLAFCELEIRAALEAEQCTELPTSCTPAEVADRTVPMMLCQEIHESLCEARFFCGLDFSPESCLENLARSEPCEVFTSVLPGAYDCAEAIDQIACDEPLPDTCIEVLR